MGPSLLGKCERCIVSGVRWFRRYSEPLTRTAWHANSATGGGATTHPLSARCPTQASCRCKASKEPRSACLECSMHCNAADLHLSRPARGACDPALFVFQRNSFVFPGCTAMVCTCCLTQQCLTDTQSSLLFASVIQAELPVCRISAAWRRHSKDVIICPLPATDQFSSNLHCSEHVNTLPALNDCK